MNNFSFGTYVLVKRFVVIASCVVFSCGVVASAYGARLCIDIANNQLCTGNVQGPFGNTVNETLVITPGRYEKIQLCGGNVYVIEPSALSNGVSGLLIIFAKDNRYTYVDNLVPDLTEDKYMDFVDIDLDRDGLDEIISFWGDEDSYAIRVNQLVCNNGSIKIFRIYDSNRFGTPLWSGKWLKKSGQELKFGFSESIDINKMATLVCEKKNVKKSVCAIVNTIMIIPGEIFK